ncbi:MAG: NAD-dependent epimerase/dehydratase family protein [Actinomycetota bacterium]
MLGKASARDAAASEPSILARPVVLGAGPVGRAVVDELSGRGLTPAVVTRSGTTVPGASAVAADLTDRVDVERAIDGATVVFQAAQPPYTRWPQEFPELQRRIVDAAATAGATLAVVENLYGYGHVSGPITAERPLTATTRKGIVRAEMWNELERASRVDRLPVVAVRGSDFIGPGVTGSAYGERFVGPIVAGRRAEVLGDPDARHTVTYVPDLAATLVAAAAAPDAWGRAWLAPNAPAVTQRQLVTLVAAAAGVEPRLRTVARWQVRLLGRFVPEVREMVELLYEFDDDLVVDSTETTERLGVEATPLADAVAATVAWYRAQADGVSS